MNSPTNRPKVLVGMSGGVDSSVAALLLQEQGFAVEGLFMKNWEEEENSPHCSAARDLIQAAAVCQQLEIPLHTANFSAQYRSLVFERFLSEQCAGRTPNPDILCNQKIKFHFLYQFASQRGISRIATGHYARLQKNAAGMPELLRGADTSKDQSYFLYAAPTEILQNTLFPLGALCKSEVRHRAACAHLPNHARPDSTGICFIGERNFRDFLGRKLSQQSGDIVDSQGQVLGRHQGLAFYTIGQRRGIGIGDGPWYVTAKFLRENLLQVARGHNHPALFSDRLLLGELRWIGPAPRSQNSWQATARIRYRQADQPCTVIARDENLLELQFHGRQRAVTPGQSAVLYDGQRCLGGGVIQHTLHHQKTCAT